MGVPFSLLSDPLKIRLLSISFPFFQLLLVQKRKALLSSIEELKGCVDYIDWKQEFYDDVLSGKRPYVSNLIPVEE